MSFKTIRAFTHQPVFPIVPCYTENQTVDYNSIAKYIEYLQDNDVKIIMTTAGTTQFNLLSNDEIYEINRICITKFKDTVIAGLKPCSYDETKYQIERLNNFNHDNLFIMLIYPERHYDDQTIIEYFSDLGSISKHPILIHGIPIRNGKGQIPYNYTSEIIRKISRCSNIVGVKEESNNLLTAYDFCKNIDTDNFGIIVAGGSQKRFTLLNSVGAHTFLTGVGSIIPKIDIDFFNALVDNDYALASLIKSNYEDKIFDVFMKIGWHPSLRTALKIKKLIPEHDRQPFSVLDQFSFTTIQTIINKVLNEK